MTRSFTVMAALAVGGVLLGAGEASAHAGHAEDAADAVPERKALKAMEGTEAVTPKLAAKCACSSAADCTCKKGTCKCPKCKKHHRDVVEALRGQPPEQAPRAVRYDASAGLFI